MVYGVDYSDIDELGDFKITVNGKPTKEYDALGNISQKCYQGMFNYKIEITD